MNFFVRLRNRYRRSWSVTKAVVAGVFADGFVHAGNLAYLSLLTLFPFFIVVAAAGGAFGRTDAGVRAVHGFLRTVPPDVATLISKPVAAVIAARTSSGALTLGILVTLWTVSGFIETIRDVIRRAYGVPSDAPMWRYRVGSIIVVVAAVVLMLIAFAAQVLLTGAEQVVAGLLPGFDDALRWIGIGRIAPAALLFGALWMVFYILTPLRFREGSCPIWPGALVTMVVWIGTTMLLPVILGKFGRYDLTYGSLAGVIVALLFFYIIGLGLVVGAHLNAALAKGGRTRLKTVKR